MNTLNIILVSISFLVFIAAALKTTKSGLKNEMQAVLVGLLWGIANFGICYHLGYFAFMAFAFLIFIELGVLLFAYKKNPESQAKYIFEVLIISILLPAAVWAFNLPS